MLWLDLESTGLDPQLDPILEVGLILTDFDLNPIVGYSEVVEMTTQGAERVRANEVVKDMHKKNGLLADSIKKGAPLAQVEEEIIKLIKETTTAEPGEVLLSGSGVSHYDQRTIEAQMPKLHRWLAYYTADVGTFRRQARIYAGKYITPFNPSSYGDEKLHRAYADAEAHLAEATQYRDLFRKVFADPS
jgi:oligoribonuclease